MKRYIKKIILSLAFDKRTNDGIQSTNPFCLPTCAYKGKNESIFDLT